MGWLILDSNQVGAFVNRVTRLPRGIDGLTLNPLVFGELVLTRQIAWIHHLMRFPVRFGVDTAGIMDSVAASPIGNIPSIDTYFDRQTSMTFRDRARSMTTIPPDLVQEAERVKKRNRDFQQWMFAQAPAARDRVTKENGGKLPRWDDASGVLRKLIVDRSVAADIRGVLSDGGSRKVTEDPRLIDAVLENMRLRRWFTMVAFFYYSVTGLWWDQKLNVKSPEKDDWTDMTSVLYARNSDLVLTDDNWLRRAIDVVEDAVCATVRLRCVTVEDLVGMN